MCSFVLHTNCIIISKLKMNSKVGRGERKRGVSKLERGFGMRKAGFKRDALRIIRSRRGLAIPVTFLMLFVSLIIIVSTTYCFAVIRIQTRGALLKASAAKQNMLFLKQAVEDVAWLPSSSRVVCFKDYGGVFTVDPEARNLVLTLTNGSSFSATVYNSSVGEAVYLLPHTEEVGDLFFLEGSSAAIVNDSSSAMPQVYILPTVNGSEVVLCYRPFASSVSAGESNGKPVNVFRIYVVSFNVSNGFQARGKFYVRVSAVNVAFTFCSYEFNSSISSLGVQSVLDGVETTVWLPVTSNEDGAVVNVEVVTCYVRLLKMEV